LVFGGRGRRFQARGVDGVDALPHPAFLLWMTKKLPLVPRFFHAFTKKFRGREQREQRRER